LLYTIDIERDIDTDLLYSKFDASKRVDKSMSSGRKIFRFLKFLEDLKKLFGFFYKTPNAVQILKALICLSGFFYHMMDNLAWAANTGIIDEFFVGEIKWKMSKNFFSLIRNLIKLITSGMKVSKYISYDRYNEEEVMSEFNKEVSNFKLQSHYNIIKQTLENRAKIRLKSLDMIHSFLRICMLAFNLKIEPFYSLSHPLSIALCGVLHASISIYKQLSKFSPHNSYSVYGGFSLKKSSSLVEKLLIDNRNEEEILEEGYFDHYYIDFNKDYSTKSEEIMRPLHIIRRKSFVDT